MSAPSPKTEQGSVKETLISITISLAMALVAKAYVVEAYVIPTGSMAPTLLGQHMLYESDQTGYEWTVNPWYYRQVTQRGDRLPINPQEISSSPGGARFTPIVTDPMTTSAVNRPRTSSREGYSITGQGKKLRAGDRILVQKFLYEISEPERYDVVVFKNPTDPTQNYIKRLVGLPGEAVFIVDGDIFTAPNADPNVVPEWSEFQIRRKPSRVQKAVWRPVFSSAYTPLSPIDPVLKTRIFQTPWQGSGWETDDRRVYESTDAGPTVLRWDTAAWPLTDFNPYNEIDVRQVAQFSAQTNDFLEPSHYFPVGDLRMKAGIQAQGEGLQAIASITTRGSTFEAVLSDGNASLRMRDTDSDGAWTELAAGEVRSFGAGKTVNVELWHVDQQLALYIDGSRVLEADYEWDPAERIRRAVGLEIDEISPSDQVLTYTSSYREAAPSVEWRFEGATARLHDVTLDKDIYSRVDDSRRAGHPHHLVLLQQDQFFVLGDNAAASADGRMWNTVHPEVEKVDATRGIVPRRLMLGKAFFVYWPEAHRLFGDSPIPIPDFGRMRWID